MSGNLETENRQLFQEIRKVKLECRAAVMVMAVAIAALAVSVSSRSPVAPTDGAEAARLPSVIEAQGFVVRDATGQTRAILGRTADQRDPNYPAAGLELFSGGKPRGGFQVQANGFVTLTMNDEAGQERVVLASGISQTDLELSDSKGDPRITLNVYESGTANLAVSAPGSKTRIQSGARGDGSSYIDVFDRQEKEFPLLDRTGRPIVTGRPVE